MIQSIKINLNKTTFTLNNDAYNLLNSYFSDLNSGGSTFYRDKAIKSSKKFDVED
jgi:hypothetical protein